MSDEPKEPSSQTGVSEILQAAHDSLSRFRSLSDEDLAAFTSALGKAKIAVAKLIKEQRDLQEKIHRNAGQIDHHRRSSKTADAPAREEHLKALSKYLEVGGILEEQLIAFKQVAEALVDRVRNTELIIEQARRAVVLIDALDSMVVLDAQLLSKGLSLVSQNGGVQSPNPESLANLISEIIPKLEHRIATLKQVVAANGDPGPDSISQAK